MRFFEKALTVFRDRKKIMGLINEYKLRTSMPDDIVIDRSSAFERGFINYLTKYSKEVRELIEELEDKTRFLKRYKLARLKEEILITNSMVLETWLEYARELLLDQSKSKRKELLELAIQLNEKNWKR